MDSKELILEEIAEEALECARKFRLVVDGSIGGVIIQGRVKLAEDLYNKICCLAETNNLDYSKSYVDQLCFYYDIEKSITEDSERITVYIDDKKLIHCMPNDVFCKRQGIYLIDLDILIDKDEA